VATAKIARKLAPNSTQKAARRLYSLWKKVGMTDRTGVDISGEERGTWYDPKVRQWAPVDLANRAFGQGVSVTLPQLARGISTIVNGGFLIRPHFVADSEAAQAEPERVLKAKTATQAKEILKHVTGSVPWYAKGSLIPGYEIGGKTGTAQIWDVRKGQWKERRFNHSFIGFVGGQRQEYVIAVRIEEPKPIKIEQGVIPLRIESYELFQMVARATITQMQMKKSKDPEAGLPIVGTEAARKLSPERNRETVQAIRSQKQTRKKEDSGKQAATGTAGATARSRDVIVASDPPAPRQGT
jgi:cell division protein FtsI/penicillin-binding protein 2